MNPRDFFRASSSSTDKTILKPWRALSYMYTRDGDDGFPVNEGWFVYNYI
jgi:hypothetical protein